MMKNLLKITTTFALLLAVSYCNAQVTNNTGLPGADLIYYQDTKSTVTNSIATPKPPNSGLTIWREISSGGNFGNKTDIPADGKESGQIGYTRPDNVYPETGKDGVTLVAEEKSYQIQSHSSGVNHNHKIWYNIESVDLSSYDAGSKFFTFSVWSRFFNDGTADRIDTSNKIYYTTNFETGANPTGGVTWTEIPKSSLINVGLSAEFGANGVWTTHSVDLSSITCGDKFAMAIVRETSSDGPNPNETAYKNTSNQNGHFYVSGLVYTGSTTPLSVDSNELENVNVFQRNNTLQINGLQDGKTNVRLFNILGKQIINTSFESEISKEINLPELPNGIYFVRLSSKNGNLTKKVLLK